MFLWRQVEKYQAVIRIHDRSAPDERLLAEFDNMELRDLLSDVSTLDD
jgi:hypothetical protein